MHSFIASLWPEALEFIRGARYALPLYDKGYQSPANINRYVAGWHLPDTRK